MRSLIRFMARTTEIACLVVGAAVIANVGLAMITKTAFTISYKPRKDED